MSLKPLMSFSSGELDPVLTDNVTLEKFNKGLSTARNVMIGKTGSILSRFSRQHLRTANLSNRAIRLYKPTNTDYLLEWGHQYVRVLYTLSFASGETMATLAHALTESDLPNIHFETSKSYVYIFCAGKKILKLHLNTSASAFVADADVFKVPNPIHTVAVTASGAPAGYKVDYLATVVINGEESLACENITGYNKPIASGQVNLVTAAWLTSGVTIGEVSEVRFYSRPSNGGAYGFLGSTTKLGTSGANTVASFEDIGSLPDYENGTQDLITKYGLNGKSIINLNPKTGSIYQQRLILTSADDEEAIIASRPGFQNNFYRDFPYAADSSLQFKAGTSGKAKVLRIVESDGLIVFTTNGVYINSGLLSVNNLGLDKKGGWIIDELLPPLVVPGGVFFVDRSNTIRQLIFSQQILAYESQEQTIFSNHLFKTRKIRSWAYQDGTVPVIIVTFSDGTLATFTYNFEHQMRAWTRHDSKYPVEQVVGTNTPDTSYFVTNKNGTRYIEMSLSRIISAESYVTNPEADKSANAMLADSIATVGNFRPFEELEAAGIAYTMSPVTPGDWSALLNLNYPDQDTFPLGPFTPGETIRWFNPSDKSVVDLIVVSSDDTDTVFEPSSEFPSEYAASPRLYRTYNVITGLSHLEGESVSVMVDGALVTSPYNDVEGYPTITVTGGSITLPNGMLGAIINVGRPIVADIKTLNVSTVEQSPTLIESLNINKLYIRVNESRGLYCSNKFPEEANGLKDGSSVAGMEALDEALVPINDELIGNTYLPPISKRLEKSLPGSWDSQGQISIRQVDPYHFEILSIIPDMTILSRSDR